MTMRQPIAICLSGLVLIAVLGCRRAVKSEDFLRFMAAADRIEFFFVAPQEKERTDSPGAVLTDAAKIQDFVSLIRLQPKDPCECEHNKSLRFWKGGEKLVVSVCDHCLDIVHGEKVRHYWMPKKLWERFQNIEGISKQKAE